jgi:SulP family sulfate permease
MGKEISAALAVSFLTIAAGSAFGVWTGVGPTLGMLSMAVASIVGVVFGGIQVKTSGPTGPTAGLMFTTIAALSAVGINPEAMMLILLASAFLLFLLSFTPIEKYIDYVPYVSIAIFVNGVSLFIIFKQLLKVGSFNQLSLPAQTWETALVIGTFILMSLWPKVARSLVKIPGGNIVSGSLAAMIVGSVLVYVFSAPVNTLNIESISLAAIFPDMSFANSSSLSFFSLVPHIFEMTFILAFITIVTARALSTSPDYGRELRNQGVANAAVSFIGGIPVTIGFVRTKLLQNGGATSWVSGVLVGVFVITAALFFDFVLSFIPTSIFIGILIKAGISSMDFQIWHEFRAGQTSLFSVIFVFVGSLLVINLDIVFVFITSVVLWWILKRVPLFNSHCSDIKTCPCVG